MAQGTNRLLSGGGRGVPSIVDGFDALQAHCDMLNGLAWVRSSRDPYIVFGPLGHRSIIRKSEERSRLAAA